MTAPVGIADLDIGLDALIEERRGAARRRLLGEAGAAERLVELDQAIDDERRRLSARAPGPAGEAEQAALAAAAAAQREAAARPAAIAALHVEALDADNDIDRSARELRTAIEKKHDVERRLGQVLDSAHFNRTRQGLLSTIPATVAGVFTIDRGASGRPRQQPPRPQERPDRPRCEHDPARHRPEAARRFGGVLCLRGRRRRSIAPRSTRLADGSDRAALRGLDAAARRRNRRNRRGGVAHRRRSNAAAQRARRRLRGARRLRRRRPPHHRRCARPGCAATCRMSPSPAPEPASEPPQCANCRFYRYRMIDRLAAERARAAGVAIDDGQCQRWPAPVVRPLGYWCGEHQPREKAR